MNSDWWLVICNFCLRCDKIGVIAAEEGKVDWVRGPKRINSKKVSLGRVLEAEEREVAVEGDTDNPDQSKVTKTVVEDIPAPFPRSQTKA